MIRSTLLPKCIKVGNRFVFRQNFEASKNKYYYWDLSTKKTVWNLPDMNKNSMIAKPPLDPKSLEVQEGSNKSTSFIAPAPSPTLPATTPTTPVVEKKQEQQPAVAATKQSFVSTPKSSFINTPPATTPQQATTPATPIESNTTTKRSFTDTTTPVATIPDQPKSSFIAPSPSTPATATVAPTKRSFTEEPKKSEPVKTEPQKSPQIASTNQTASPTLASQQTTAPQKSFIASTLPSPSPEQVPSKGSFVSLPIQPVATTAQQPTKRSFTEVKQPESPREHKSEPPKQEEKKPEPKPEPVKPQPEPVKPQAQTQDPKSRATVLSTKKSTGTFLGLPNALKNLGSNKQTVNVNSPAPKEQKSEDDFDDFGYATNDATPQPQAANKGAPLAFKKDDNFEDSSTKLAEDNSQRATVMQENPFANSTKPQSRELEETLQAQLFYEMGKGEIHVLAAIRCYYYLVRNKNL